MFMSRSFKRDLGLPVLIILLTFTYREGMSDAAEELDRSVWSLEA